MEKLIDLIDRKRPIVILLWGVLTVLLLFHFLEFRSTQSEKHIDLSVTEFNSNATPWKENSDSLLTPQARMRFYEIKDLESSVFLKGWAFIDKSKDPLHDSVNLILESTGKKRWRAPLFRFATPDVVEYFERPELSRSGFQVSLDKGSLENGRYRVGLLFVNKANKAESLAWFDYEFEVNISVELVSGDIPAGNPLTMRYSIYSIDTLSDNIQIEGWAFPESGFCPNCKPYFTISSASSFYSAEARRVPKPDVVSYFNDTTLLNTGLSVKLNKGPLQNGSYKLGILLKDTTMGLTYFVETNRLVHLGLSEFALPERINLPTSNSDSIRAFTDKVVDNDDHVEASGWAFINGLSTDFSKTYLVLKSEDNTYALITTPEIRSDIQDYFKLPYNVDLSGFSIKFKRGGIKSGEYQICILMLNKKTNKKSLQYLNATIKI